MAVIAYVSMVPEWSGIKYYRPGQVFYAESGTAPARWIPANSANLAQNAADMAPVGPPSGGAGSYQAAITTLLGYLGGGGVTPPVSARVLTFNDNTPLQFSDGSYLELAA